MLSLLLIDDEKIEQKLFEMALKTTIGNVYTLDYAPTIASAVPLLKSKEFDLIFLDDQLSNLENAVVTVPQLLPYTNGAPIVVVSKSTNAGYMKNKNILGVADIVNKFELNDYLIGL